MDSSEFGNGRRGMTLASSRLLFVASLALAVAACQTEDKPSQPGFTSYASDAGTAVAAPSVKATSNRYFIEFRSRYAYTYGHSLVIFGRLNQSGQMVNPEVAGLAPKSADPSVYVLGHVAPVPASTGWTDGDLEDVYRSASWRVMLTEAEYRKVVAKIRQLQASSPLWHASLSNCNAFVANIARSMGYRTPGVWLRPQEFITRLREMNSGATRSTASSANQIR